MKIISKDKLRRAFRNFGKLRLFSQLKISRDTFWRILNLMIVPILGSFSYFFVSEAWINFRFGRTNLSFDEIPVEGHPTMVICFEHPTSPYHYALDWLSPIELYYHKLPHENVNNSMTSMKLKFGDNYFDDENIVLSHLGYCYSITPKPLETYRHKKQETRFVEIFFPNHETPPAGLDNRISDIFAWKAFHVFFTHEDNALSVAMGLHLQEGEAFEAKMIRQYSERVTVNVELKTKKTQYIKEKTTCTDEKITVGPDLAQAVQENCQCYPREFPIELANSGIPFCQDIDDEIEGIISPFWVPPVCYKEVWRKYVKENSKLEPCTKFEFTGNFKLLPENAMFKETNFIVKYQFQQPETVLLIEEYYVMPTFDLIGLIGGTLGIFVGFSFYGTFADALSLTLSIATKMIKAGKNELTD